MPRCAVLDRGSAGYPEALEDLAHPPSKLYALSGRGPLAIALNRTVAIVGTRDASPYGVRVATQLARSFAECGVAVVSGLARGIDAAAHRGALDAAGHTIAVLGTGVDVPYPVGHRALHEQIAGMGHVLAEAEPGTPAKQGCFPRRNRIIAALASVTIVVEAPWKSGAINTATQALDLGRTVAAVPGPIDSARSAGSNQLLRDGAQFIGGVADALALFGLEEPTAAGREALSTLEAVLLDALADGPLLIEDLCEVARQPSRVALAMVSRLELRGLLQSHPDGSVGLSRPNARRNPIAGPPALSASYRPGRVGEVKYSYSL